MYVRKTIDIEELKKEANRLLACKDNELINKEFREGVITFIEHILKKTGNYKGFIYIEWKNGGCTKWVEDGMPIDNNLYLGDTSRRIYY